VAQFALWLLGDDAVAIGLHRSESRLLCKGRDEEEERNSVK
jgi:hypothetical protein